MSKTSFICFAFGLFLLAPLAFSEPLSPADVKALLARIKEKRAAAPQVQADFQEEKTVHMLNKPITTSGKMWFQSPNKFRREAKGNSPSITVSDGKDLWIYYPKFNSAEHYALGKRSPLDAGIAAITASLNLENVEGTYNITGDEGGGRPRGPLDASQPVDEAASEIVPYSSEQRITGYSHRDAAAERRPHHHDVFKRVARADSSVHVCVYAPGRN